MKTNKWIIVSLCAGLLFSSFGSLPLSYADEAVQLLNDTLFGQPVTSSTSVDVPSEPISPPQEEILTTNNPQYPQDEPTPKRMLQARALQAEEPVEASADAYNFSAEDLKQLLEEGYTFEDIIKADDLGNRLGVAAER
ncbi:hypothetical protein N0M98_30620 [Paenibacillus doosanensis]|uniref:hypothetical protein n=1 Tax=Paenibacillus doosanensis TaxID=1229154 RepID=UPI00217FEA81|nr:hypothetical protein [Paenibacillus doosanensis]MCS7464456.1 hypothetical protein [Paenibacillus doosanensis]